MDSCEHLEFSGLFTNDEKRYKRADCRLVDGCIYPAKYCAAKHQNEVIDDATRTIWDEKRV